MKITKTSTHIKIFFPYSELSTYERLEKTTKWESSITHSHNGGFELIYTREQFENQFNSPRYPITRDCGDFKIVAYSHYVYLFMSDEMAKDYIGLKDYKKIIPLEVGVVFIYKRLRFNESFGLKF